MFSHFRPNHRLRVHRCHPHGILAHKIIRVGDY
jgi:hypothetical protein